jgi:DNA-binding NarL/FixJ family response regulator
MGEPIRVLVVDDHALVREGFVEILDAEPDITVVGEAGDGAAAVAAAGTLSPDVVVMDVRMPGVDGIAATTAICARTSARVLMLTTYDLDQHVYDALRAGASGFLLKSMRGRELVDAVRVVAAGEALLAPERDPPPHRRDHRPARDGRVAAPARAERVMVGNPNHGRLHYRCKASRDYVRQHGINHPPVLYLCEDAYQPWHRQSGRVRGR